MLYRFLGIKKTKIDFSVTFSLFYWVILGDFRLRISNATGLFLFRNKMNNCSGYAESEQLTHSEIVRKESHALVSVFNQVISSQFQ